MQDERHDNEVKDPVCGMTVDTATATLTHEHEGQTFYFWSDHCLTKFRDNPSA